MNTLSCYIIDDERHAAKLLAKYVQQTADLSLIGYTTDALKAKPIFQDEKVPDITFLDIDMPLMNGLDFADHYGSKTNIVFTTAFRDYGPEAFQLNAKDYLLKPIDYDRFMMAVNKIKQRIDAIEATTSDNTGIFVQSQRKGHQRYIPFAEIFYLESSLNYQIINTASGKIPTWSALSAILQKLPKQRFARIHRSFVVNLDHIKGYNATHVTLGDGIQIPIGRLYRPNFLNQVSK